MAEDRLFHKDEKTRLCPSCRMSISVLATKCRFCGETVGRPKDETRQLSISDLGGETVAHYAPSSNVMEALEAFRSDETATKTPEPKKRTTIFGRKSTDSNPGIASDSGLPELDDRSKALASLAMPVRSATAVRGPEKPTWMKKVAYTGAFIASIIILYFGTIQGWAMIRGLSSDDAGPAWVNKAPGIIESGGNPVEALQAANEALKHDNTPQNQEIMERARAYFTQHVQEILNATRIRPQDLSEASNLANAGWQVAPSQAIQALRDEVNQETMAYSMRVVSVDRGTTPPTATIELYDKTRVQVKQKDTLWSGRFLVQSVVATNTGGFVRLIDTKRTTPTGSPRQIRVDELGIPQ